MTKKNINKAILSIENNPTLKENMKDVIKDVLALDAQNKTNDKIKHYNSVIDNIKINDTITFKINTTNLIKDKIQSLYKLFEKHNLNTKDINLNDQTILRFDEILLFSFNRKSLKFNDKTIVNLIYENTLNNQNRIVKSKTKDCLLLKKPSFESLVCKYEKKENTLNLTSVYNALKRSQFELSNNTYQNITERNKTFKSNIELEITDKTDIKQLQALLKEFLSKKIIDKIM